MAEPKNLLLPVGISFYTFQMISYVADVYRGTTGAERNLLNLGLYMSFFPKMIQGPIERYQGMGARIRSRHVTPELFACGARRFIYGLGKKVILANQFGSVVDKVLANPMDQISGGLGWYVGILYTLQIYFDFSGYSDMAVGLGKMLGFELTENFNYPYLSRSVGEFWRRWHISLSSLVQGLPLHSSWRKQEGDAYHLPQSDDRVYLYRILAWRGSVLYCVGNVLRLPAGGGRLF